MSLSYLTLLLALIAIIASPFDNTEVRRASLRHDFTLQDFETLHMRDDGYYSVSDTDDWNDIHVLQAAVLVERLKQISGGYGSAQAISISDLGLSGLLGATSTLAMQVNGFGQSQTKFTLPYGVDANSFISKLNAQLGNQFVGIYDGSDLISDLRFVIGVPAGFSALNTGEIIAITP